MYKERTVLKVQQRRQRVVIAKREMRLARAEARDSELGPWLKQGTVSVRLCEQGKRHKPRSLHLVVHPGRVAWYADKEQRLPLGRRAKRA